MMFWTTDFGVLPSAESGAKPLAALGQLGGQVRLAQAQLASTAEPSDTQSAHQIALSRVIGAVPRTVVRHGPGRLGATESSRLGVHDRGVTRTMAPMESLSRQPEPAEDGVPHVWARKRRRPYSRRGCRTSLRVIGASSFSSPTTEATYLRSWAARVGNWAASATNLLGFSSSANQKPEDGVDDSADPLGTPRTIICTTGSSGRFDAGARIDVVRGSRSRADARRAQVRGRQLVVGGHAPHSTRAECRDHIVAAYHPMIDVSGQSAFPAMLKTGRPLSGATSQTRGPEPDLDGAMHGVDPLAIESPLSRSRLLMLRPAHAACMGSSPSQILQPRRW